MASGGGAEGWPHPLGGPEHREAASQFKAWRGRCVVAPLQAQAPVPSQRPLDATIVALKAADVPADVPLKHR